MHDYKKYTRSFIIMTPESSGYAADGQKLTGTALLEIRNAKGTLTVNIHGLKAVGGAVYKLYLINSGDSGALGVLCGIVTPAERGKTVKVWEFDPLNVGGSGIEFADFNVVALVVKNIDLAHNEITAPLVGYLRGTVIWKSGFKEYQTGGAKHVGKADVDDAPAPVQEHGAVPDKSDTGFVTEATAPAAPPILAIEPAPPEEYAAEDGDYIFERIITGAPQGDGISDLCRKIEPFLPQSLRDKTEPMFHRLKETLPEDKFGSLVTLAETVTEYVPVEAGKRTSRLIAEIAESGGQEERRELLGVIGEYAPGKVMESLIEASEYSFPYLGGFGTLPAVLEGVAKSGLGSEERKITLKSGLAEPFTLREPSPGEDHNARFKETLHSFAERAAQEEQSTAQEGREGIQVAEGSEPSSEVNAQKRGSREGFDEAKLLRLFDGRQGIFPFKQPPREEEHGHHHPHGEEHGHHHPHGEEHGHHHHPHPPHVPPVYKTRWITIGENDFGLLPIESLKYINNPFAVLSFKSYRHYILGVSGHGARQDFYLGVPGTYSERSRVTATSLGFESFMPVSGGRPWHGDFGYWLVEL